MKKFSSILLFLLCVSAVVAQNGIQPENKKTRVDSTLNLTLDKTLDEINERFKNVEVERLVDLPIWGMVGGEDKKDRVAGIKRMVERLRATGNKEVKYTEFPGANHAEANSAVFSSEELVDWMLGFSKSK